MGNFRRTKHFDLRANNKAIPFLLKKQFALADKFCALKTSPIIGWSYKNDALRRSKLEPAIGLFFHAIGINIKLGYGMTETTATVSCWHDSNLTQIQSAHSCQSGS